MMQKQRLTPQQAYPKICKFCAYQERTQHQVRNKLHDLGVFGEDAEQLLTQLILDNFINEERYAMAFAGGKFRLNKWGKLKIKEALKAEQVSDYCIKKGLSTINASEYDLMIKKLIRQKKKTYSSANSYQQRAKIVQFLRLKGFEPERVWEILKQDDDI